MSRSDPQRRLRAMAVRTKEWAQVWRDPSTFGLVVLMPLLLMLLFGSAVTLDVHDTRLAIVDHDHTRLSRDVVFGLQHNAYFSVVEAASVEQVAHGLRDGKLRGIVVIPDGFQSGIERQAPFDVQLITDGSQVNTATFLGAHLRAALASIETAEAVRRGVSLTPAITLTPRYFYNPELESRFMLVPGAIGIVMAMIGSLLTALIMAREYERGTMEGLLATPISIPSLVLNKLVPYFVLGLASACLCVAVAVIGYGLPFRGSLPALVLILAAFLAAVLGQGLLISAATKNQFVSTQFALLSGFLPSLLLSGFLFEIDSMPRPIQWLTYIVPARYLIPALQSEFLVGDVWPVILPNIAILFLFGAAFYLRVIRAIKRTIA